MQKDKYIDLRQYEQAEEIQPGDVVYATLVTKLSEDLDGHWQKRVSELHDTFQRDLVTIYGFVDSGYNWCPVDGEHVPYSTVVHLVPHHLPYAAIGWMFSGDVQKGRDICWDRRNGLLLTNHIAEAYYRAQCTIIPGEKSWRIYFLALG